MKVDLRPELERRLNSLAEQRSRPVEEVVEEAIMFYLASRDNEPSAWVEVTRERLPEVWPTEDFTDWAPPHGR
jgi:predicted transcriptional regulator